MAYVTPLDIREYMQDVTADDNDLLLDLAFTDEQIQRAMRSVMREWNSLPPYVDPIRDENKLPFDTNIFLDGAVAALLRMHLLQKTRNEVDYQAGNAAVNTDVVYIKRLKELIPMFEGRFKEAASNAKLSINLAHAYGQVG